MLINSLVGLFFQNKRFTTGRTNFLLSLPKNEYHEYFQMKLVVFRILSKILPSVAEKGGSSLSMAFFTIVSDHIPGDLTVALRIL